MLEVKTKPKGNLNRGKHSLAYGRSTWEIFFPNQFIHPRFIEDGKCRKQSDQENELGDEQPTLWGSVKELIVLEDALPTYENNMYVGVIFVEKFWNKNSSK